MEETRLKLTPANSGAVCEIDLFGRKGLNKAIQKLNFKIVEHGYLLDVNGKAVRCSICQEKLTKDKISAFFAGSVKQVCDKPECFVSAIYESKREW